MLFGAFLLLLGLSILLKAIFKIDLPLVRICFALFLLYLGVKVLLGPTSALYEKDGDHSAVFKQHAWQWKPGGGDELSYNTVFGRGRIDLSQARVPTDKPRDVTIEVNTIFGDTKVIVDTESPVSIVANAVFGEARLPDGNSVAFGSLKWKSRPAVSAPKAEPRVRIRGSAVFGKLVFVPANEPDRGERDDD